MLARASRLLRDSLEFNALGSFYSDPLALLNHQLTEINCLLKQSSLLILYLVKNGKNVAFLPKIEKKIFKRFLKELSLKYHFKIDINALKNGLCRLCFKVDS